MKPPRIVTELDVVIAAVALAAIVTTLAAVVQIAMWRMS